MRNRIVRFPLFAGLLLLLLIWPWTSSLGQSSANYELCSGLNHINANAPMSVAVDEAENIYVAEAESNRVRIFDMNGAHLRSIRGLSRPISVAVDSEGHIYVGNYIKGRSSVAVYDSNLDFLFKLGSGDGEFRHPTAIAVSSLGKIYIADRKQDIVKVYFPDGSFDFSFGSSGNDDGQFNSPTSLFIQGEFVVVTDLQLIIETGGFRHEGARMQIFTPDGQFVDGFSKYGQGDGFLTKPLGVAINSSGTIFVADAYQNIVQGFDNSGIYQATVYSTSQPMRTPLDIACGPISHRLYVASLNSDRVDFYCPPGNTPPIVPVNLYSVTASVSGEGGAISSGTVTIEADSSFSFEVEENGSITLSLSADNLNGYHIENVLIDGVSALSDPQLVIVEEDDLQQPIKAEYAFTGLSSDHTVAVLFAVNSYTITADVTSSVENCGAISPSGSIELLHGASQTFTISFDPAQCYFLALVVDGVSVTPQENWPFPNVAAGHTIQAVFGSSTLDSDGDGIPDYWEIGFGMDPYDSSDAAQDWDGDGGTNLSEFLGDTNPLVEDVGAVRKDFNGDGKSDILLRSSTSTKDALVLFEMDGNIIKENNRVMVLSSIWQVAHIGDFTGDNKVDTLIHNANTHIIDLLEMDGSTVISRERVCNLRNWDIATVADFTGDGKEDILLRKRGTKYLRIFEMDGPIVSSNTRLDNLGLRWDIAGSGDFNGDGKSDILLRDTSRNLLWLYEMDGSTINYKNKVTDLYSNWKISGIADFTGDKKADILLRDILSGLLVLYVMDGDVIISNESVGDLSLDWDVADVADYSGDGKADILLRDMDSGALWMYEMDGSTISAKKFIRSLILSWQPQ